MSDLPWAPCEFQTRPVSHSLYSSRMELLPFVAVPERLTATARASRVKLSNALRPVATAVDARISQLAASFFEAVTRMDVAVQEFVAKYSIYPGVERAAQLAKGALEWLAAAVQLLAARVTEATGLAWRWTSGALRRGRALLRKSARAWMRAARRQIAAVERSVQKWASDAAHRLSVLSWRLSGVASAEERAQRAAAAPSRKEASRKGSRRHMTALHSIEKPLPETPGTPHATSILPGLPSGSSLANLVASWRESGERALSMTSEAVSRVAKGMCCLCE